MCHQLSNGADTSMARPPQAEMNAPSGPEKPQMRTLMSRNALPRKNVAEKMRYADAAPASTPQA